MHARDSYEHALIPDDLPLDIARLDQHLLCSVTAVRTLVDTAQVNRHDVIADLGAGTGVITREVIRRSPRRIHAIEIDAKFTQFLAPLGQNGHGVDVILGDILTSTLSDTTKVVANPPFRLTEQLIDWLGTLPALISATMVMGRAFGKRATAAAGSPDYNRLSLKVQARYAVRVIDTLSPRSFHPPTRGAACIVQLVPKRPPARIDQAIDDAFAHRGGMRLKDLLWHLHSRSDSLGPTTPGRHAIVALRGSTVVRAIQQRRLQQITSYELSTFMAELHRRAESAGWRDG